jgi:hypothetical protein
MRRTLIGLLLAVLSLARADAAQPGDAMTCTLNTGTCGSTVSCDAGTATNWSGCGLTGGGAPALPDGNDICVIANQITGQLTTNGVACRKMTIQGSGSFAVSTPDGGGDAQGFVTFTLKPGASEVILDGLASTGKFRMGPSTRLLMDTTAGTGQIQYVPGFDFALEGAVYEGFILPDGVSPIAGNTLCDGVGTDLQYYELKLSGGLAARAKVGRRLVFKSGQMVNRQFEIVKVNTDSVGFCTDLNDATPATDLTCDAAVGQTCGQRLRGHVAIGRFPNAAAPTNSRHGTPASTPNNDICVGDNDPEPYCTGANVGTGTNIYPYPGDLVAIVDDVWAGRSTGSSGWYIAPLTNQTAMPKLRAFNMWGCGVLNALACVTLTASDANSLARDVEYGNLHDYVGGSGIWLLGWHGFLSVPAYFQWNACHDVTGSEDSKGCAEFASKAAGTAPGSDYWNVVHNMFYRGQGEMLQYNYAGTNMTARATGVHVDQNLVFDGCSTANGECSGLELDACFGCTLRNNAVFDIEVGSGASDGGTCISVSGGNPGAGGIANLIDQTLIADNFLVNCGGSGIQDYAGAGSSGVTETHNYISNVRNYGIRGGRAIGNLIRNHSMEDGSGANRFAIANTVWAIGNFMYGNDKAVRDGAGCATACSGGGILINGSDNISDQGTPVRISDNVVAGSDAVSGGTAISSVTLIGDTRLNASVTHMTVDGGNHSAYFGFYFYDWAPVPTGITLSVTDSAVMGTATQQWLACPPNTGNSGHVTETVGFWSSNKSAVAGESSGGILVPTDCSTIGTEVVILGGFHFRDRAGLDYGYTPGAPELTAGASGGVLGSRGFRFNPKRINAYWGGGLPFTKSAGITATDPPFPQNFANVDNRDTDEDGVMDFLDNCIRAYNPTQWDADLDGSGDACDH